MSFEGLLVTEIFYSIQGESTQTGLPFWFIRLTGCNLRCSYCDTTYAFKGGKKLSIEETVLAVKKNSTRNVLLTGGEPLLQRNTPRLIEKLLSENFKISVETHGEVSIENIDPQVRIIMDIKTPGSQMCRYGFVKNLPHLKPQDEIKFVLTNTDDYIWAINIIQKYGQLYNLHDKVILFSAANGTGQISLKWLAEKILEDNLNVRLQTQLHKWIWGAEARGV